MPPGEENIIEDATYMHVDRPVADITFEQPTSLHKALMDSASDGTDHSIKDFLARPFIVKDGQFTLSQIQGTEIMTIAFPEDILQVNTALGQKAAGFLAFRGTLVLRLQVNANRFQQGRLLLNFFPGDDVLLAKHYTMTAATPTSLMMTTQLPRAELDIATDSDVVFKVPFVSPYLAYNLTDGTGHVGHVGVVVYSPLQSVTSGDNVEMTMWGHFEDIELMYPTISNGRYVVQSGDTKRKMKDPSSSERSHTGPISSTLQRISRVSSILTEVPALSSVAGPVGWFSSIAANAASAMGFSNPQNGDQSCVVVQKIYDKAYNVDGRDNSHNLALFADNQLEILPGAAANDVDEMSLQYVLGKWAWIYSFNWDTTQVPYTQLDALQMGPTYFTEPETNAGGKFTIPLSYFSNYFRMYRGSFKLKFKLVKTEFHSGRLGVAFMPGWLNLTPPTMLTAANLAYLHKDIHDIRDTNEFEFTVPYAATVPWTKCTDSYGSVVIFVVNTLRAPPTVTQSIQILVEAAAAEDFQFAQPVNSSVQPYLLTDGTFFQSGDGLKVMKKASEETNTENAMPRHETQAIGNSRLEHDLSCMANRHCVGEVVTSLRQLVKRSTDYAYVVSNTSGANVNGILINPWMNSINLYQTGTGASWTTPAPANGGTTSVDWVTIVSACYTFSRGGVRIRTAGLGYNLNADYVASNVVVPDSKLSQWPATLFYVSNDESSAGTTGGSNNAALKLVSAAPAVGTVYPRGEFQIPYQSRLHMRYMPIDPGPLYKADGTTPVTPQVVQHVRPVNRLFIRRFAINSADMEFFRQAADDYSCHFWSGTPPVYDFYDNSVAGMQRRRPLA